MQTFLDQLADAILSTHRKTLRSVLILVPNRRGGAFLKKALIEKSKGNSNWLPLILSIEDYVARASKLRKLSGLELFFKSYQVYKKTVSAPDSIEDYLKWAPQVLADFSEIDAYLVKPNKLFQFVNEVRAMEVWNVQGEALTETQRNYLSFWESLEEFYGKLTELFITEHVGYSGFLSRYLTEHPDLVEQFCTNEGISDVYIAGFNAISESEKKLINQLKALRNTEVKWDADNYYLNNQHQEAGMFLRRNSSSKSEFILSDGWTKAKHIKAVGVPGKVAQTKYVGDLLSRCTTDGMFNRAVVLADESLLIPVLDQLPDSVASFNVTLGYPLSRTPLFGFLAQWLNLHEISRKMRSSGDRFYYKELFELFRHPIMGLFQEDQAKLLGLEQEVIRMNRVFIPVDNLLKLKGNNQEFWRLLFEPTEVPEMGDRLQSIIHLLEDRVVSLGEKQDLTLLLEQLTYAQRAIRQLRRYALAYDITFTRSLFAKLFKQILGLEQIPFLGEPMEGLQIMGVLETRMLDFKEVFIVSANEGVLPAGKKEQSFIPHDIKRQFGLPTFYEKDAVFAYHFYRMLQRAERVELIYNSTPDLFSSGEPSRYIKQLMEEYVAGKVILERKQLAAPEHHQAQLSMEKTPEVLAAINAFLQRGVSPSAFNLFIASPLDFYLAYIAGIRDDDRVDEEIEDSTFGDFIHSVLEDLYAPCEAEVLDPEAIRHMKNKVFELLSSKFAAYYGDGGYSQGANWLSFHVALKYLNEFLEKDASRIDQLNKTVGPTTLVGVELELKKPAEVAGKSIVVKGKIDRVERRGGRLYIIDYKSGNVEKSDLKLAGNLSQSNYKPKLAQLLFYRWLGVLEWGNEVEVIPAIWSFRKLDHGLMEADVTPDAINSFGELIAHFVGDLLSENAFMRPSDYAYPIVE